MRLHLSPWQSVATSVPVAAPVSSRLRKRSNSSDACDTAEENSPSFVASFVASTKRYRQSSSKKRKKGGAHVTSAIRDETVPSIAVTSSHRVSVLGRVLTSSLHQDEHPSLQECSQWQYSSRPDKSNSFFQRSLRNGVHSATSLPQIPASMDARNDRVYAVQDYNSTLVCWNASLANGPDDPHSPSKRVALRKPALSLYVLPSRNGKVCGTCVDGSLFVGKWEQDSLQVQYSRAIHLSKHRHVATFMNIVDSRAQVVKDRKRKAVDCSEADFVLVYQVFVADNNAVVTMRFEVDFSQDSFLQDTSETASTSMIKLAPSSGRSSGLAVDADSIVASPMDERTMALSFRMSSVGELDKARTRSFSCLISLEAGRQVRPTVELPGATKQVVAISSSLLAIGVNDEILFFDVLHGAVVHSVLVPDIVGDCKEWMLVSDARKARIAIIGVRDGHVYVSVCKAGSEGIAHKEPQLGLATGLRSAAAVHLSPISLITEVTTSNLIETFEESSRHKLGEDQLDVKVEVALLGLRVCLDTLQDPGADEVVPYHFLSSYEKAVTSVKQAMASSYHCEQMNGRCNPQDDIVRQSPMENGSHHTMTAIADKQKSTMIGHAKTLLNGRKTTQTTTRAFTPSSLPQRFLDGATSIVLSALQLPKQDNKIVGIRVKLARLDARLILSRLLHTGRISARLHFDLSGGGVSGEENDSTDYLFRILRATKLANKRGRRVLSPVDLMHEILTHCPDVSERNMVTMAHYMLCRALPEDIAEHALDSGYLDLHHPSRQLAKEYFKVRSSIRKQTDASSIGTEELEQLKKDEKKLATNLLTAGLSVLMRHIIQYSRCNETLLRNALASGLPTKDEPGILAHVLADMLSGDDSLLSGNHRDVNGRVGHTLTITNWICALCDSFSEQLMSVDANDDSARRTPAIDYIRQATTKSLEQTEIIVSVRQMLNRVGTMKTRSTSALDSGFRPAAPGPPTEPTVLPPYRVERLVF